MKGKFKVFLAANLLLALVSVRAATHTLDYVRKPVPTAALATKAKSVSPGEGVVREERFTVAAAPRVEGGLSVGDRLVFKLFEDRTIELELVERQPSVLGGESFSARITRATELCDAVVVRTDEGLQVNIQSLADGRVFTVSSGAFGVVVRELDSTAGLRKPSPSRFPVRKGGSEARLKKSAQVVNAGGTDIDVLVACDAGAKGWLDSEGGGMTNFALTAIAKMNASLANTGLDASFRFRLVGVVSAAARSSDLDSTLDAVTDGTGAWKCVSEARDEFGADIVTVLIDTGSAYGTTGLGWSLRDEDNTGGYSWFSENAYNVCSVRSVAQSHTMTHEVGHNMGAGHSERQSVQPGPQLFSYSCGYYFTAKGTPYHTIMAYDTDGVSDTRYVEIPFFSSPDYVYEGEAVGTAAQNDNTRTLRATFAQIAAFRASTQGEQFEFGPFGNADDVVIDKVEPTIFTDVKLTFAGESAAVGDCVAAYRKSDGALCGLGKVVDFNGRAMLTVSMQMKEGAAVHFKAWRCVDGRTFDVDESCDRVMPEPGSVVEGLVLTVGGESGELKWLRSRSEAIEAAKAAGKRVLMISGRETCSNTVGTRDYSCEDDSVKGKLASGYVVWFNDCDNEWMESSPYSSGLESYTLPLVCVIDPFSPESYIVRSTGYLSPSALLDLLAEAENAPERYAISYDLAGGENASDNPSSYTTADLPITLQEPTRDGYEFLGWILNGEFVTAISEGTEGDVVLTAAWEKEQVDELASARMEAFESGKLLFVLNGSSCSFSPEYTTAALNYIKELGADFTDHFVLFHCDVETGNSGMEVYACPVYGVFDPVAFNVNWEDGLLAYGEGGGAESVQKAIDEGLAAGLLLPPCDSATTYLITYDADGGIRPGEGTPAFYSTAELPIDLPEIEKAGCVFDGWMLNGTVVRKLERGTTGHVVLKAKWRAATADDYVWSYVIENGEAKIYAGWYEPVITPMPTGDVVIPSELGGCPVTEIGDTAFAFCPFKTLRIPATVKRISDIAFDRCENLSIIVDNDNAWFSSQGGVLYNKDKTVLVRCPGGVESVVVPSSVVEIESWAFNCCDKIVSINLPIGVKKIGVSAFGECRGLRSVILPEGLEEIEDGAFYINYCQIKSLTIPASVNFIGGKAFSGSDGFGTGKLNELIVAEGNARFCIVDGMLYDKIDKILKWCPESATKVTLPDDTKEIEEYAFQECSKLTSLILPETVEAIGSCAFDGVTSVTSLVLPPRLKRIGSQAFLCCYALQSLYFRGNAPYSEMWPFDYTSDDLICYVRKNSLGWKGYGYADSTELPEFWPEGDSRARKIAYWDDEPQLENFKIEYLLNGGTNYELNPSLYNECSLPLMLYQPRYAGHVFSRWLLDGKAVTEIPMGTTGDITLTAVWDGDDEPLVEPPVEPPVVEPVVTNTITYVGLEGASNPNPTQFTTNDLPLTLAPLAREGYTFLGWTPNGGMIPAGTVTNVMFAAQWEEIVEPTPVDPVDPPFVPPTLTDEAETVVDIEGGESAPYEKATAVYDGYVVQDGVVKGTIQVKVAKAKVKKSKGEGEGEDGGISAAVTATVQMIGEKKKLSFKGGVADAAGTVSVMSAGGHELSISLGVNGLGGELRRAGGSAPYQVDGARNVFSAKDPDSKATAKAIESMWVGAINVVGDDVALAVSIAKKGKVKVSGTVNGAKVTATSQLLVGETACCVSVVVPKANLAFNLWLMDDGTVEVDGLEGVVVGKAGALKTGAKFALGEAAAKGLAALPGLLTQYLPTNLVVAVSGKKWVVAPDENGKAAKAGKVMFNKKTGAIDEAKLGENPSALKLTYTAKTGSFKGSFKAYTLVDNKVKAYTFNITGVMIDDTGYGTATLKKPAISIPIVIE